MDIQKLIAEIIPPADYQHRNGFSNNHLIDQLSEYEKNQVEDALINKLLTNNEDTLIVETLAHMKSKKSLAILNELLEKPFNNLRKTEKSSSEMRKIIIASSIFEIIKDERMINIATEAFKRITNKYSIMSAFYYLKKFEDSKVNDLVKEYTNHPDYLVSENAKEALSF
jgi:hypothetical protein